MRTRNRGAVDQDVLFGQMPAARPNEQRGGLLVQPVRLAVRRSRSRSAAASASRRLIWPWMLLSHVGVLASSKSAMKTFAPQLSALMIILRSTGPGDFDAAILDVRGYRRARPVRVADRARFRQKIGQPAGVELRLAVGTVGQQLGAATAEGSLQASRKGQSFRRQDFGVGCGDRAGNHYAGAVRANGHRRSFFAAWRRTGPKSGRQPTGHVAVRKSYQNPTLRAPGRIAAI